MYSKQNSVKNICELFFKLEKKYELLDYEIEGVFVWHYIRMHLYYKLAQKAGVLEKPHNKKVKVGFISKVKNCYQLAKYVLFMNPFSKIKKEYSVAIYEHERHVNDEGLNVDIYTKHIRESLVESGVQVAILDRPNDFKHYKQDYLEHRYYLDWVYLYSAIASKFVSVKLDKDDLILIRTLEKEIKNEIGVDFELVPLFVWGIKRYKTLFKKFRELFSLLKIEKLYVVVSYGFYDVIAAAKSLNINVIELQHGIVGKYHLGYNFNSIEFRKAYLPDEFICWSSNWKGCLDWPFSKVSVEPFLYQKNKISQYSNNDNVRKSITIISQGALGSEILKYTLENYSRYFVDTEIVYYKLHPSEYVIKKDFFELERCPNIKIVCDETPLYELFSKSHTVMGVFSTALYEAEEMGCIVKLMPLTGVENASEHPSFQLLN